MLETQKQTAARRINEVRQTLEVIKRLESPDPLKADSIEVLILRGLFYVHLYGTLEYAVNQSVQAVLIEVSSCGINFAHFEHVFYSVVLDSQFTSIRDGRGDSAWKKRIDFLRRQISNDKCELNDSVFSAYLQNIWVKTLEDVFLCFGISDPVVPEARLRGYVDEIVDKRNAIAHGRESPADVGAGTRSPDLHVRLEAITTVVDHLLGCFERYLVDRQFVAAAHRANYLMANS